MKLESVAIASRNAAGGEASQILADWPSDVAFNLDAALRRYPEFADRRSVLVDLAYEEYCRLEGQQAKVDRLEFAGRYPQFERSLLRVLELHSFCQNDSDIRRAFFAKPWPEAGNEILGFRLVEEIGRGAASRVFLASDPDLSGRLVVIKVGRALDEAAALGRLDHPGIVPVLSARIDPVTELSVLCMPFRGRGTLLHLIDRLHADHLPTTGRELKSAAEAVAGETACAPANEYPIPDRFVDAVARVGASLADALAFAHAQGIVHSDVKPSNILITADGRPLLLDFNLARDADADERLVGGTLPYMAPEQLAAWAQHDGPIGPATDVFALGATLQELLTGKPPFGWIDEKDVATSAATLAERHRRGPTPIPHEILRSNRQLGQLIAQCLSADPAQRPTAAALSTALAASIPQKSTRAITWLNAGLIAAIVSATTVALLRVDTERLQTPAGNQQLADAKQLADRGWERLSNDEVQLAYEDLKAAYAVDQSPRNAAALGYCVMRLTGDWYSALRLLERARAGGEESVEVVNAIGYCHLKLNELEQANENFATALEQQPAFEPAKCNALLVGLIRARQANERPDLDLVRKALSAETRSAVVYLDAASSFAQACAVGDGLEDEVIACSREAIARGLKPQSLAIIATINPRIGSSARFSQLIRGHEHATDPVDLFVERVPPPFSMSGERSEHAMNIAGR